MRVTRRYNQHRRDLQIDMVCESCGAKDHCQCAYDDHYFWSTVVPGFQCPQCGKSSNDLNSPPPDVSTRYGADEVV